MYEQDDGVSVGALIQNSGTEIKSVQLGQSEFRDKIVCLIKIIFLKIKCYILNQIHLNRRSATVKNKQKGFIKEYQTQNQIYCHHKLFCLGERFDEMEIV